MCSGRSLLPYPQKPSENNQLIVDSAHNGDKPFSQNQCAPDEKVTSPGAPGAPALPLIPTPFSPLSPLSPFTPGSPAGQTEQIEITKHSSAKYSKRN